MDVKDRNRRHLPHATLPVGLACACVFYASSPLAQISPAPNSAYKTDTQETYTEDLLNDPLSLVNNVLCHYDNSLAGDPSLTAPYVAWIDERRCDADAVNDFQTLSEDHIDDGETNYNKGLLNLTQDGDSISGTGHWQLQNNEKAWGSLEVNQQAETFIHHLLIDRGDGSTNQSLRTTDGNTVFIEDDSDEGSLRGYVVRDQGAGTGRGLVEFRSDGITWEYGYTDAYYCRRSNGPDIETNCFSRSVQDAQPSVWEYQLYNLDGSRFERTDSGRDSMRLYFTDPEMQDPDPQAEGFQVLIDSNDAQIASYIGYDLPSESAVENEDGEKFTLHHLRYRLDQYVGYNYPLEDMSGVPFWIFENEFDAEVYWDNDQKAFVITGYDAARNLNFKAPSQFSDSDQDKYFSTFAKPQGESVVLEPEHFFNDFLKLRPEPSTYQVWNYQLDSQMTLRFSNDQTELLEMAPERDSLNPADVSLESDESLYCYDNCTDPLLIDDYEEDKNSNPFVAVPEDGPVEYRVKYEPFLQLVHATSNRVVEWPSTTESSDPNAFGSRMELYLDDNIGELGNPDYALELGLGYDSTGLTTGNGEVVQFAEPLKVAFEVPEDSPRYAGATMILGVNDGQVNVPGSCYDKITSESVPCSDPDAEWRHDIFIPFDEEQGRVSTFPPEPGSEELLVKWLERELALGPVDVAEVNPETLRYGDQSEFTDLIGDFEICDPQNFNAACYIDEFPSNNQLEEPPAVIHGEIVGE